MSAFPISAPTLDEPERVHAAWRHAKRCWGEEQEALTILDGISGFPVYPNRITVLKAQEAVHHAEERTCNAVELLFDAIRETRQQLRQKQTA